ncbi:hypothetical protein D3C71_1577860 [compost metagenome]
MNGQLRCAVFLLGGIGHLQARGFLAAVPHTADPMRRTRRRDSNCGANAQAVQGAYGIGCQVDICTDPQEGFRLFEYGDVMARAAQGNGGGQASDTGTGNRDIE